MDHGNRVLRRLRARHGHIAPRGRFADADRRGRVRPRPGRGHGVLREHARRHHGVRHRAPSVPRRRARAIRAIPHGDRPRRRKGRCVLPLRPETGAGRSVLRDQLKHGADADFRLAVLLGEPARHVLRHRRLCERRRGARPDRVDRRHPLTGAVDLLRTARPGAADRQEDPGGHQGAQGPAQVQEAAALRQQPGRHRRGFRGPRRSPDRRHREGQGDPDRAQSNGRRLPEHRLRAEQVAVAFGQDAVLRRARQGVRLQERHGGVRLRRGDGTGATHHQEDRAARLGRALHRARRELHHGGCTHHLAVQHPRRRSRDHDPEHRHRHRRRAVRAADSGIGRGWLLHVGHDLGDPRVAVPVRGAGRRTDRQRAGPGLPTIRRRCDHGGAGAPSVDA